MFNAKVQVLQLEIDTMHEKILYIEEFSLGGEVKQNVVNLYSNLKALQLYYNHSEVYGWIVKNFTNIQKPSKSLSLNALEKNASLAQRQSMIEALFNKIIVKGTAEFSNISTIFKLNDELSAITFSHIRLTLSQEEEIRSNSYDNRWANMVLANRHWTAELMVESLWWSLGNLTREHTLNKKQHMRGSPFFLGLGIFKLSSYGDSTKLDTSIHVLRSEYSAVLANFVSQAIQCVSQYRNIRFSRVAKLKFEKSPKESPLKSLVVSTKIKEVNIFLLNNYNSCIVLNLSEIVVTKQRASCAVELLGLQVAISDLSNNNGPTISTKAEQTFISLQVLRGEHVTNVNKPSKLVCQVMQDTTASWNSNLHMHILSLLKEIKDYKVSLKIC